jgi:hypothetical protein
LSNPLPTSFDQKDRLKTQKKKKQKKNKKQGALLKWEH